MPDPRPDPLAKPRSLLSGALVSALAGAGTWALVAVVFLAYALVAGFLLFMWGFHLPLANFDTVGYVGFELGPALGLLVFAAGLGLSTWATLRRARWVGPLAAALLGLVLIVSGTASVPQGSWATCRRPHLQLGPGHYLGLPGFQRQLTLRPGQLPEREGPRYPH